MTQHMTRADGMEEELGFDRRKRVSSISLLCATYHSFYGNKYSLLVITEGEEVT